MNAGVPEYCRVINSTFNNFAGRGVLASKWLRSEIINCRFVGTPSANTIGVQLTDADISIRDCNITAKECVESLNLPSGGTVEVSNCTLNPADCGIHITVGNATPPKFFINNVKIFGGGIALFGIYSGPGSGTDNIFYIDNLYVNGVTAAGFKSQGRGSSKYFINRSVFDVNVNGIQSYGGHSEAEINDCRFMTTTWDGGSLAPINCIGETSGKIRGRNNYFLAGVPNVDTGYQRFTLRQAIGSNISSSSTISLGSNFDTYHVTGTTQINTISTGSNNFIDGKIYLIADGAWSLGNGGNIRPKVTTARTATEVVALMYDPATALWYEIGW